MQENPPLTKKRNTKNYKRSVKKKDTAKHSYDKWVKLRAKLQEADVERKRDKDDS